MTTPVLQNGRYQAVCIPEEIKTECKEFVIRKIGRGYLLAPTEDPWFPLRLSAGQMPEDFMEEREEPAWKDITEREDF